MKKRKSLFHLGQLRVLPRQRAYARAGKDGLWNSLTASLLAFARSGSRRKLVLSDRAGGDRSCNICGTSRPRLVTTAQWSGLVRASSLSMSGK